MSIRSKGTLLMMVLLLFISLQSCKKFLDAKPDKKLVTPTTIQDLQAILDYYQYMNILCSEATEIAADNYFMTDAQYASLPAERHRDAYLWKSNIFQGKTNNDWVLEYDIVYNANVVLDNIKNVVRDASNSIAWDNCYGSALLFRGKAFYEISQVWCLAFDSTTSTSDLGIPLRLTSDFNQESIRSNLKETYSQIIQDIKSSISLLPVTPVHPYRPSKPAAYGLLARVFLSMRDYKNAKLYADSCLQIRNTLLDYNNVPDATRPFSNFLFVKNPEDIMNSICAQTNFNLASSFSRIDTNLYRSYDSNDLRKKLFFNVLSDGSVTFKGSYSGSSLNYNGVAVDEMFLIRAECYAREGNVAAAMADLNTVMQKRWKAAAWVAFAASNANEALNKILLERRKELVYRMLRFTDIKRLNKEGAGITIKRIIQGQTFTLAPNDPRTALPIPEDAIMLGGIQQNPGY